MELGWLKRAGTLGVLAACIDGSVASAAPLVPATARFIYLPGPGADPCADEATLKRAVVARLGHDPFRDDSERTVVVSLQRDGPDLAGRIELRDRDGRTLGAQEIRSRASNCAELAAALELTLSMVLDARVAAGPPRPSRSEASGEAVAPPALRPSPSAEIAVTLGALVALASAPSTVAGASLGLEARWPSYSLALEGRVDSPSRLPQGEGYIQTFLWMATLVPCLRHSWLGVCGLFAAGVQEARAVGIPGGDGASAPYLAPGARLAFAVPLSSIFTARLHADLLVPVEKTSLYTGSEQAWTTPPASFVVGLALGAQISR